MEKHKFGITRTETYSDERWFTGTLEEAEQKAVAYWAENDITMMKDTYDGSEEQIELYESNISNKKKQS